MYRFFDNYSVKHEERLSPSEKILREEFLSDSNKRLLYKSVSENVSSTITYGTVTDFMCDVFTESLHLGPILVDDLNRIVLEKIVKVHNASVSESSRRRELSFVKHNIPGSFVPRPSFVIEDDDEERGKFTIEFPFARK